MIRVQGIAVGSRASFEAMNRAITANGVKPVIDRTFPLTEAAAACGHLQDGAHFGKIGVTL
jgi:NADPH:quinone reductase-like Zn-dependent oxidoreductase